MYDELVKRLRDNAEFLVKASSGCLSNSFADTMCQAADAIEELQKRVPKRPHGKLIDADALIEDLKYDVELDVVALDSMEIVGDERRKIQDDKDFKQNCIFWIENVPTVIPAEERNRRAE